MVYIGHSGISRRTKAHFYSAPRRYMECHHFCRNPIFDIKLFYFINIEEKGEYYPLSIFLSLSRFPLTY